MGVERLDPSAAGMVLGFCQVFSEPSLYRVSAKGSCLKVCKLFGCGAELLCVCFVAGIWQGVRKHQGEIRLWIFRCGFECTDVFAYSATF